MVRHFGVGAMLRHDGVGKYDTMEWVSTTFWSGYKWKNTLIMYDKWYIICHNIVPVSSTTFWSGYRKGE